MARFRDISTPDAAGKTREIVTPRFRGRVLAGASALVLVAATWTWVVATNRGQAQAAQADEDREGDTASDDAGASEDNGDDRDDSESDAGKSPSEESDEPMDKEEQEKVDPAGPTHPFPRRIKAPELSGGEAWINTAGPIDIKDLKGKFVLLDFWTYCCINCMHILPELKKLEHAFPNELVVIGVHSAKFDTEQDSQNITDAVQRYEIEHPVINDSRHEVWNNFSVESWPSLRVIDPEGNLVGGHSGEIAFEDLKAYFDNAIPYYRDRKLLDEKPLRFNLEADKARQTPLRYPGKVLADEAGNRLFIADSNHNRIVVTDLEGALQETIGDGGIGAADGDFASARFDHPQGMALLGETLYVADTENHLLRLVDLAKRQVTTIAGTGQQSRVPDVLGGKPIETALNSPWDLWIHADSLFIAMAGPHQIWRMSLDGKRITVHAGNGREDIVDGPLVPRRPYDLGFASFAQPSGLASDGKRLFVADSEGSSIRSVPFDPRGEVETIVGTSQLPSARLFTFGDVDGEGAAVRLQHALGVAYHADSLYVADTYNNKIKVIDPDRASCRALAGDGKPGAGDDPPQFDEPAGISVAGDRLYVADTNNHVIRVIDLAQEGRVSTLRIDGLTPPEPPAPPEPPDLAGDEVTTEEAKLRPVEGRLVAALKLDLPLGYKINDQAPMRYRLALEGDQGPLDRASVGEWVKVDPPASEFEIRVPLVEESGADVLRVTLQYYYCQEGDKGLCKMGAVTWTAPVELSPEAESDRALLEWRVEK